MADHHGIALRHPDLLFRQMIDLFLDPAALYSVMLIFARVSGLLLIAPAFSASTVPIIIRLALALALSWIFAGLLPPQGAPPSGVLLLALALAHEIAVGLLMGFAVRLVFYAVEMAGQIMSTEIGLMATSSLDPITKHETSPLSILLSTFATVLFFAVGAHHLMFMAFLRSFELLPTAAGNFDPRMADFVVRQSGRIFLLAIQMSAPLIAINFLVNFSLAILSRAAPSINAFLLSIPIQIATGFLLLGAAISLTAHYLLNALGDVPELMLRFIR